MAEWILCEEGKMPEDVLEVHDFGCVQLTDEVLIPRQWGNENGGGSYLPAYRYKLKKHTLWHWSVKTKNHTPLCYLPIPKVPHIDVGVHEDFIRRVRLRAEMEERESDSAYLTK